MRTLRLVPLLASTSSACNHMSGLLYVAGALFCHPDACALLGQGLPAASMQWGAWAGSGMAANNPAVAARLQRVGLAALAPAQGLAALSHALTGLQHPSSSGQLHPAAIVGASFLWSAFLKEGREAMGMYAEFRPAAAAGGSHYDGHERHMPAAASRQPEPTVQQMNAAAVPHWHGLPPAAKQQWVSSILAAAVVKILGRELGGSEPLMAAGLDSLGKSRV